MTNKKGKFFLAGIIGAVVGGVSGLLFAPQSGKKTRNDIALMAKDIADQIKGTADDTQKRVKEVFGQVTDKAKETYRKIQSTLSSKVASVKAAGKEIDKDKYGKIVDDVVAEFKTDLQATKDGAKKMADQLKKDWAKVKKALV